MADEPSVDRSLDDVVETMRAAHSTGRKTVLFLGAGCSTSAGIPDASGVVAEIEHRFPLKYSRTANNTYGECMASLSNGERRDLIGEYIDDARMNWSHLAAAQLVKTGFVDRVLTTNFDPLMIQACASVGIFPAVYDLASAPTYVPTIVPDPSIFYLHGQRAGVTMVHTAEDAKPYAAVHEAVFADSARNRVWVIIGYSGNDPVFNHLAEIKTFDYSLFWIGFSDLPPSEHVSKHLLMLNKDAFFVRGYDSDQFLISLAQKLGVFPPEFVGSPFTHLEQMLENIAPFPLQDHGETQDLLGVAKQTVKDAIEGSEAESSIARNRNDPRRSVRDGLVANRLVAMRHYDSVIALRQDWGDPPPSELVGPLVIAYTQKGIELTQVQGSQETQRKSSGDAMKLFAQALQLDPIAGHARLHLMIELGQQFRTASQEVQRRIVDQSFSLVEGVTIDPLYESGTLNVWGLNFVHAAEMAIDRRQQLQLFRKAETKLQAAVAAAEAPLMANPLTDNLSRCLMSRAELLPRRDAIRSLGRACSLSESILANGDFTLDVMRYTIVTWSIAAERLDALSSERDSFRQMVDSLRSLANDEQLSGYHRMAIIGGLAHVIALPMARLDAGILHELAEEICQGILRAIVDQPSSLSFLETAFVETINSLLDTGLQDLAKEIAERMDRSLMRNAFVYYKVGLYTEAISLGEPPAGEERILFNINRALAYRALNMAVEFEAEVRKVERWQIDRGEHSVLMYDAAVLAFRNEGEKTIECLRDAIDNGDSTLASILHYPVFTELIPADTLRQALAPPQEES